jgi:hypothetical protein
MGDGLKTGPMGLKQDIDCGGRITFRQCECLERRKKTTGHCAGATGLVAARIERETNVRRETATAYLKAAGISVRLPGAWGRRPPPKPANEVSPDSAPVGEPTRSPTASTCEPFFDFIELSLSRGRNAKAIYQDLVGRLWLRWALSER